MKIFFVFLSFFISFFFMVLVYFLSFFFFKEEEKTSSFECGFMVLEDSRVSFSIQFFLFSLVFLVFDVEVALLLPSPLLSLTSYLSWLGVFSFLSFLLFGLFYEWFKGVFDWIL